MADFDAVVIGAGVVGLACGAHLAQSGRSVLIVDRADAPGSLTSARNSEVIHAGLYYPTGSLKHQLCIEGRRLLYPFLEARGIGVRRCGKLVVATDDAEIPKIEALAQRAMDNDVEGIALLDSTQTRALCPDLRACAALWSPQTGVFDSHGLMLALQGDIEAHGGWIALNAPFVAAEPHAGGFHLHIGGAEPAQIDTPVLINAAGLFAPAIARMIAGVDATYLPEHRLAKGSYFRLNGRAPFDCLVYPAPVDGGLGIHATLDLGGQVRFGPDVEWLPAGTDPDQVDYQVDPTRAADFTHAIRRYWPGLADDALGPDYAGCRPKLSGPNEPAADFRIDTPDQHGIPGLVQLFGIESPGLTASLAIARRVGAALDQ